MNPISSTRRSLPTSGSYSCANSVPPWPQSGVHNKPEKTKARNHGGKPWTGHRRNAAVEAATLRVAQPTVDDLALDAACHEILQLQDRIVRLESDKAIYREIATAAIHQLHRRTRECDRLREQHRETRMHHREAA